MRSDLAALLESAGEPLSSSAIELLLTHVRLLARWNERFNLTRITSWPGILDRHLKESLIPLRWIGQPGRLIDVGSGNGFPGIPILACRNGLEGVLVERSEKKSLFLEAVIREAGRVNVRVETRDLQSKSASEAGSVFDYVISRATLPPSRYLELAVSLTAEAGRAFLFAREEAKSLFKERSGLFEVLSCQQIPGRADSVLFVLQRRR